MSIYKQKKQKTKQKEFNLS